MTKGVSYVPYATTGTGTSKAGMNSSNPVGMPAWARELVEVSCTHTPTTIASVKVEQNKLSIESNDVDVNPTEIVIQPQQAFKSDTTGDAMVAKTEKYQLHIPLQGGEDMYFYATPMITGMTADLMGCTYIVSDRKEGRHRYAKTGTATSTGTTATVTVDGTAYNIHGSEEICEAYGTLVHVTPVTATTHIGYMWLTSSDFLVSDTLNIPPQWPASCTLTTHYAIPYNARPITRYPVAYPTKTTCTIVDHYKSTLVTTSAAYWTTALFFYKAGMM